MRKIPLHLLQFLCCHQGAELLFTQTPLGVVDFEHSSIKEAIIIFHSHKTLFFFLSQLLDQV